MPHIPDASSVTRLRAIQSSVVADPVKKSASYIPNQPHLLFNIRSSTAGRGLFPSSSVLSNPIVRSYVNPRHQGYLTASTQSTAFTLSFLMTADASVQTLGNLVITPNDKPLTFTIEWDETGSVSGGSQVFEIEPNTQTQISDDDFDLGGTAVNVPVRFIFDDPTAVYNFVYESGNTTPNNTYAASTAPTNFSGLIGTNQITFNFQAVETLDLTGFVGTVFNWYNDTSLTSINLTNVSISQATFSNCSSLTTLTLTGFVFRNPSQLYLDGCALSQATVNALLVAADASGATGGLLDISGGTNAAPSGAGATAVTNLRAKGWTITTA